MRMQVTALVILIVSSTAAPATGGALASYEPLPSGWNIPMNIPGWLSVGAQYCTQSGDCKVIGEGPGGLPPIPIPGGGTAPPSIGCRENPEYALCISSRVPVQLLARSQAGSVIVRMHGRNYAIAGIEWSFERPDGSSIGGPIMVKTDGEILPLQNAMGGRAQKSHQVAEQRKQERIKASIAGILRMKREPCDELLSVTKDSTGLYLANCLVSGQSKQYKEGISGLE
jgi:hypothetical protein